MQKKGISHNIDKEKIKDTKRKFEIIDYLQAFTSFITTILKHYLSQIDYALSVYSLHTDCAIMVQ